MYIFYMVITRTIYVLSTHIGSVPELIIHHANFCDFLAIIGIYELE